MYVPFRTGPEDKELEEALSRIPARARSLVIRQILRAALVPGGLSDVIARLDALEQRMIPGTVPTPSEEHADPPFETRPDAEVLRENWRSALAAFGAEDELG